MLFPFTLRDTLLRAAERELYLFGWSKDILEEMRRNLVRTGHTTVGQSHALVHAMLEAFPEAEITGYEYLIPFMPNDEKDRHVVAASVRAGAQVIVTENVKDFKNLPEGLEARTSDRFLCDLFDLSPSSMSEIVNKQAEALRRPPRTIDDILRGLGKFAPNFVSNIKSRI